MSAPTCAKCSLEHDAHTYWADESFVEGVTCDYVLPESEYELKSYPKMPGSDAVTYVTAEWSAWTIRVTEHTLHLTLGDMGYHDIPRRELATDNIRQLAQDFDETGAVNDIEQILLAAKRLLN
jgi:hypothetical protein